MAFKSIHNQNPFVIPAILFGFLIFVRHHVLGRSIDRTGRFKTSTFTSLFLHPLIRISLIVLFLIALFGVPIFEGYFKVFECSVSRRYYEATIGQSVKAIQCFDRWKIDYWLDYATLLNQLRGQTINGWDHDADFSIIHPDYSLSKLAPLERAMTGYNPSLDDDNQSVSHLLEQLTQCGLSVSYDSTRHLIQTHDPTWRRGPHTDIWLWIPARDIDGSVRLWTADHTVRFTPRPVEYIFPLSNNELLNQTQSQTKSHPTMWLGVPANIPRKPHHISSAEFNVYGGSYLLNQVFRGDCFHNFFNLRWLF